MSELFQIIRNCLQMSLCLNRALLLCGDALLTGLILHSLGGSTASPRAARRAVSWEPAHLETQDLEPYRNNFGARRANIEVRSLNQNSSYFLTISGCAVVNTDKLGSQFRKLLHLIFLNLLKMMIHNLYSLIGIWFITGYSGNRFLYCSIIVHTAL